MEGCFLGLRNTRVFVGNVIGTNRHPLATASLTAGSLAARIAVSSRSMKITANMGQPPYWPDVYSTGGVWGLKLSLNLLGDFLEISVFSPCALLKQSAAAVDTNREGQHLPRSGAARLL